MLNTIKTLTENQGFFTIHDVVKLSGLPHSTINDWVRRLLSENFTECIKPTRGRVSALYAYKPKPLPSISPCKRIFATVDQSHKIAEIFHECMSEGAIHFCSLGYRRSGGVVRTTRCEGPLLRIRVSVGRKRVSIGPPPAPSLGIEEVSINDDKAHMKIKASGGPAYSLTKAMTHAKGVLGVEWTKNGRGVEGTVTLRALRHLLIAVDDTDSESEGATWALTLDLLRKLCEEFKNIEPISHKVVALNPSTPYKTVGNYASFIELGVPVSSSDNVINRAVDLLKEKTYSNETAIAIKRGLRIPAALRIFSRKARSKVLKIREAYTLAHDLGIEIREVTGRRGAIGAMAALSFADERPEELLISDLYLPRRPALFYSNVKGVK
jgi:methanogenesis imperfect marker protein 11